MQPHAEHGFRHGSGRHLLPQHRAQVPGQPRQGFAHVFIAPLIPPADKFRAEAHAGIGIAEGYLRQGLLEEILLQFHRGRRRGGEIGHQLPQDFFAVGGRSLLEQVLPQLQQSRRRGVSALQLLIDRREGGHPVLAGRLLGDLLAELVVAGA